MTYYAMQVKTRGEEKFIKLFKARHPEITMPIYFPKREMKERHGEETVRRTLSIFPGYIFIEMSETEKIQQYQWAFRRTDGFFRFLHSNQKIVPLEGRDLEIVLHFIKTPGGVAGISKIYFNENDKIVVMEGPLKGMEGKVVKIDKRKGRAKIKLDLYDDAYLVDLAFEVINPN
jgi:transcriptional antiterminator NusG